MTAVSVLGAMLGAPAGAGRAAGGRDDAGARFGAVLDDAGRTLGTGNGDGVPEAEPGEPAAATRSVVVAAGEAVVPPTGILLVEGIRPTDESSAVSLGAGSGALLVDDSRAESSAPAAEMHAQRADGLEDDAASASPGALVIVGQATAVSEASAARGSAPGPHPATPSAVSAGEASIAPASAGSAATAPTSPLRGSTPDSPTASTALSLAENGREPMSPEATGRVASPLPAEALAIPAAGAAATTAAMTAAEPSTAGAARTAAGVSVTGDGATPATASPASSASGLTITATPPAASAPVSPADPSASAPRTVAAQVSPAVLNIAQRPAGSHQLTMTVNPDSLGPVTLRAHIGRGGDVQVELVGATDAGRDALRAMVSDLRRDLAAVMPHATLSLGNAASTDAGASDRGTASPTGGAAGDQTPNGRDSGRGDTARRAAHAPTAHDIPPLPHLTPADAGAGLDTFA